MSTIQCAAANALFGLQQGVLVREGEGAFLFPAEQLAQHEDLENTGRGEGGIAVEIDLLAGGQIPEAHARQSGSLLGGLFDHAADAFIHTQTLLGYSVVFADGAANGCELSVSNVQNPKVLYSIKW